MALGRRAALNNRGQLDSQSYCQVEVVRLQLVQELILANASGLGISEIFDKVYPYPVAARINQKLIVEHQEVSPLLQTALDVAFKLQ